MDSLALGFVNAKSVLSHDNLLPYVRICSISVFIIVWNCKGHRHGLALPIKSWHSKELIYRIEISALRLKECNHVQQVNWSHTLNPNISK